MRENAKSSLPGIPTLLGLLVLGLGAVSYTHLDVYKRQGQHDAIIELLEHPRVMRMATPRSEGGEQTALAYAAKGMQRRGAPAHVTGDFGRRNGALRLDYVLPSTGFALTASGVF